MKQLVCVCDDDALTRLAATGLLEDEGFAVADFECGDQCFLYLQEHAADVVMVFTDVQMPGTMDGIALAQAAAESWPWLKLIVTSGAAALCRDRIPAGATFLPKPWRCEDVVAHARH